MHNTKLISLLKTFSNSEFKEFGKFVSSPYHSRGRNLMPLYMFLKNFHPAFTHKTLEIETAWKKIYPEKAYNKMVMRKLISDLEKIGEDYLVQINLGKNSYDYYKRLSTELQERQLMKLFDTNIKKASDEIKKTGINTEYFKNTFELSHISEEAYFKTSDNDKTVGSLLEGSVHFIIYSLSEIMEQIRSFELVKHYTRREPTEHLMHVFFKNLEFEKLLEFIKSGFPEYGSILEMQHYALKISTGFKDDGLIEKIWELYNKNFAVMSRESKYLYYSFISGASAVVSQNNADKNNLTFEIIKFGLKQRLYIPESESYMDPYFYRLSIHTGIDVKQYGWVKKFIDDYTSELQQEYRDNMNFYGLMVYHFYTGNFEKALRYSGRVKFDLFQFKLDIRVLTLMIYYELNYTEEAFSLIDSFRHFITENKLVTEKRKKHFLYFIRVYNLFLRYKSGDKEINLSRLKKELNNDYLVRSDWFIEKFKELEK